MIFQRPSRYFRVIRRTTTNVVKCSSEPFVGNQGPGVIQNKEEEKRIAGRDEAKRSYWKNSICFDDDEDETLLITPVLHQVPDINYVDASPPNVEIVSLELVEIVDPEVERIDDDILLTIKGDTLREKLLNVNLPDCPDCDDSRARGFVLRSLELHILSFILGIRYPNLID
ncbi:hypothetical protein Tco_0883751 [Tanacetum coccineum]